MHVDFVAHVRLRAPAAGGDFGGDGRGTALQRAVAVGSGFRGTRGRSFPDSFGQGRVLAGGFAVVHVHLNELEGFGSVSFHRFIVGLQHGLLNDILRAGRGWVGDLAAAETKAGCSRRTRVTLVQVNMSVSRMGLPRIPFLCSFMCCRAKLSNAEFACEIFKRWRSGNQQLSNHQEIDNILNF